MELTFATWPFWIGLFVLGTMFYIVFAKPTYFNEPQGDNFSNPIHTKPIFKIGCFLVLAYVMFMVLPGLFNL